MILFVTRKYPPSIGGMQRFSYHLARRLAEREEVRLISWGGSQAFLPVFLSAATIRSVWCFLQADRPRVVYLGDPVLAPLGALLKGLSHVPLVVTVHGRDIVFPNKVYQYLLPKFLCGMDRVVCVSEEIRKECLKRGLQGQMCVTIPNGVDVEDFKAVVTRRDIEEVERRAGIGLGGKKVLLSVGRLVPKKGFLYFIADVLPRILETRDDVCSLIVGDGPQYNEILKLVKTQGLEDHVRLLGSVPMDSHLLRALYGLADVFVMPNVPTSGDMEGFGIITLEAWAAGTCVVASRVNGIKSLIRHAQDGLLIDPYDFEGFAAAVLKLLQDDVYREALEARAKERVKTVYSWDAIAEAYSKLLEALA